MARRGRPPRPGGRPTGRKRRPPRQRTVLTAPPLPDTPEARLEEATRKEVAQVVAARKADLGLSEPERLLARILDQHPEHLDTFESAKELRATGDDSSPFLHVALHRIVEQRVVSRELKDEMSRLAADRPWHEAVHAAAEGVAFELFGTNGSAAAQS